MNDLLDFEALKVSIASPEVIRGWSFGEILKPETINYRTLKAEKDGLFAENIFGPTKDFECYCGKYKRIRYRGVICDKCGVEVTQSKVRRERMGHIQLATPVAHIWFIKGAPSKLSLVMDLTMKNLEAIIYFASYLVIEVDPEAKQRALDSLVGQLKEKRDQSGKNLDQKISELKHQLKASLGDLKKKFKDSKEKFELASSEMELAHRQEAAKLRETHQIEESQLEEIYKAVSDLVKSITPLRILSEDEYSKLIEYQVADFTTLGMGAEALLKVLEKIDLDKLAASLRDEVSKTTGQRHVKATKRLRLVEGMRQSKINPSWMILTVLPVLPPDLRPMVQLPGGRFATSDLNDLYRRVINRNNRLKRLIELGAPEIILRNEKRMLQEAVDSLIDTTSRATRRVGAHQLRSLSDMLRGKQGRFRQNLLGKRVDYSGRSVIIVGPKLKLHQVGLPKEMALEMFKPFVLRELITRGLASNVKGAKNVLEFRPPEVWDILEEVIKNHPVLINRAPTLHRLGIQAFYPILIDGDAIQIHPCICAGFNADFDGDQMAVHVPLSEKAIQEAISLMMAKDNILKPSDSSPVNVPNREMALGSYYVTSIDPNLELNNKKVYSRQEAILAYQVGKLGLREKIRCHISGEVMETSVGRILFNQFLPEELQFINETINAASIRRIIMNAFKKFDKEAVAKLIDDIKEFGFWGATISGMSLSITDNKIIPEKSRLIAQGDREIAEIEDNLKKGLITNEERRALSQEVWTRIGEEIVKKTFAAIEPDNPIQIIIQSGGARATTAQIAQTSGMRGFSVDPTGKIVELPTKSNYREGLGVFEYFTSCRGARKGVADKSLRTADAGYLTRRLVDVSHDVIIRLQDCGSKNGISLPLLRENISSVSSRFLGRKVLDKVIDPKGKKVLISAGAFIEEDEIGALYRSEVKEVTVKSVLTCQAKIGVCSTCYGLDLSLRLPVSIGTPVGVVAAQAIGEPGTQLSMRTFHSGGVVGIDITQGLPRVEELFEARTPKTVAPISEIAGKVTISETDGGRVVRVRTTSKPHEEREYLIPVTAELLVEDGQLISAGIPLATGHLDITEVLRVKGLREAQRYIVEEAKGVYESQGVFINEKHFEVIVRKMSDKVRIETQGDTVLLPGEVVDRNRFEDENTRVLAEGGEPATAGVIILGITRASLQTDSFLSAASFQETTTVLADAASVGKTDNLIGLKENVIIGRLIPTSPERAKLE